MASHRLFLFIYRLPTRAAAWLVLTLFTQEISKCKKENCHSAFLIKFSVTAFVIHTTTLRGPHLEDKRRIIGYCISHVVLHSNVGILKPQICVLQNGEQPRIFYNMQADA